MNNSPTRKTPRKNKYQFNFLVICVALIFVVGLGACSDSEAQRENDELRTELATANANESDLQDSIDELTKKYNDLEYTYVPEKRAILDAEYAEDIAAACEDAKSEYDREVVYVSASYKSAEKIWPIVYSSAQFATAVEACSLEVRNTKQAEAAIAAAKTAQADACESFAAAGNYTPSDQDISTSGNWQEEWETYYNPAQYVAELKACAKAKKPKTVVAGKSVTRSGGGGSPAPANNCHPSYSPCIPNGPDLDCPDIGFRVTVHGPDSYRLDRDGDGVGCESY